MALFFQENEKAHKVRKNQDDAGGRMMMGSRHQNLTEISLYIVTHRQHRRAARAASLFLLTGIGIYHPN
jgi:hypothetical protein